MLKFSSMSTNFKQYHTYLQRGKASIRASPSNTRSSRRQHRDSLVRRLSFGKLLGAGKGSFVQPAVSVHSHRLALVLLHVDGFCCILDELQQASDSHFQQPSSATPNRIGSGFFWEDILLE